MTEFFYNDTQPAFAETRIIHEKLQLSFLGHPPFVVKPGMPFEGHVNIMFEDQVRWNVYIKLSRNSVPSYRLYYIYYDIIKAYVS